jgi:hypothetical protein
MNFLRSQTKEATRISENHKHTQHTLYEQTLELVTRFDLRKNNKQGHGHSCVFTE